MEDALSDPADEAALGSRESWGRIIALLAARDGDIAGAEDALGSAIERALRTWRENGVPANPEGWLYRVALNARRDAWSSAAAQTSIPWDGERHDRAVDAEEPDLDALPDRRLELLAACARPEIEPPTRPLLMLSVVLGMTGKQIAEAMALPAATVSARLTRAKKRVAASGAPFVVPDRHDLPERLQAIQEAIYGVYAIEWAHAAPEPRDGLVGEAVHLAALLARLCPDDAESHGLAAFVSLSASRSAARRNEAGELVPLGEQDPARWDRDLVAQGEWHLREAHRCGGLGRFCLEAALQAVHMQGVRTGAPDWAVLRRLSEDLDRVAPSAGASVSTAAVVAELDGPRAGLDALDALGDAVRGFQPAWALRAHLLSRLGRAEDASAAFDRAIALTTDPAERAHLQRLRG